MTRIDFRTHLYFKNVIGIKCRLLSLTFQQEEAVSQLVK